MNAEILFDGKGSLASALRKFGRSPSARTSQQQFADHLTRCLDRGEPAFIDAETGVGKTLGYLIPLMLKSVAARTSETRPIVVVSTATIALQKQIMADDLPIAIEAVMQETGVTLKGAFRVGRRQVVDSVALLAAVEEFGTGAESDLADEMAEWCQDQVKSGVLPLRSDLITAFADRIKTVPPWLSSDFVGLSPEKIDADAETVALFRERIEACEVADVLVVNHHLLALHMISPFLWLDDRPAYVAVDEADRLPSTVEDINRSHVPLQKVIQLAEGMTVGRKAVLEATGVLSGLMAEQWDLAWTTSGGGVVPFSRVEHEARQELVSSIGSVRSAMDDMLRQERSKGQSKSLETMERISTLDTYCIDLDRILKIAEVGEYARAVLYYTPIRRYPGMASVRQGAAFMIANKLCKAPSSPVLGVVFTSATLSTLAHGAATVPKRALAAFLNACGFVADEISPDTCAVIAPDRFGSMDFVRPALAAPSAFKTQMDEDAPAIVLSDDALDYWRSMVDAAHSQGGRTLVLLPALRDVIALSGHLAAHGDALVAQTPGYQTDAAIARFMAREDSIWVSASAWEGVSLVGAISHIVIPRLPIPPSSVSDSILERYLAETTGSDRIGKSVVFARRMAETRRRLRQGIGRGIRSHDDHVQVWIGDPRWPLSQRERDATMADQPRSWSPTMVNAIPERFRKKLDLSPRYEGYKP